MHARYRSRITSKLTLYLSTVAITNLYLYVLSSNHKAVVIHDLLGYLMTTSFGRYLIFCIKTGLNCWSAVFGHYLPIALKVNSLRWTHRYIYSSQIHGYGVLMAVCTVESLQRVDLITRLCCWKDDVTKRLSPLWWC